jgi:co-chaperonin GroES (HSP10)
MTEIKTFSDRIIIKPSPEETVRGGLIMSERNITDASYGTVVAVGDNITDIFVGDVLYYTKNSVELFTIDSVDYGILPYQKAILTK